MTECRHVAPTAALWLIFFFFNKTSRVATAALAPGQAQARRRVPTPYSLLLSIVREPPVFCVQVRRQVRQRRIQLLWLQGWL
jgi:hypothetical protein